MKTIVALCCLVAVAFAAPPTHGHNNEVPIVHQETVVEHDGHFHYSYETGDGTKAEHQGELRVFDKDHTGEVISGRYSYQGDDGKTYTITYTADETGYHPDGEHLPVAPEIPAAIARSLEYIAAHPYKEEPHGAVHGHKHH